jgi:N-methylhydantoinase A
LCTKGHPDTLLFREGGRIEIFNFTVEYPDPYVPRSLTFEVPERTNYDGSISENLDKNHLKKIILKLKKLKIESVAVCLLWSTINPYHEKQIGEVIKNELPNIPFSLSHEVNPTLREYRRASSTCINASLKPIMSKYLKKLKELLFLNGFNGELLMITSQGGIKDINSIMEFPIHLINSGPSMAPVAGNFYLKKSKYFKQGIVTDLGGTTFDISLIKNNKIPRTRETWIGEKYRGHMTGFSSIDIRSIGAGGGSIAWIDKGGMLHVGPESAGANPGPVCYDKGGEKTTVTDAALILGILNSDFFLGGNIKLNKNLALKSIKNISKKLGMNEYDTALSILDVVTQNMAQEIKSLTIHQGINPSEAIIVAGGGASGINILNLAKNLGCKSILIPDMGPVISASGAVIAELTDEFSITYPSKLNNLDLKLTNKILKELFNKCNKFAKTNVKNSISHKIDFFIEAKLTDQVWEIEVPITLNKKFSINKELIKKEFNKKYLSLFEVVDLDSEIEIIQWNAKISCKTSRTNLLMEREFSKKSKFNYRNVYIKNEGFKKIQILNFNQLIYDKIYKGPNVIETPFTSIFIDRSSEIKLNKNNSLEIKIKSNDKAKLNEGATSFW